jgi:hypothetical protein
MKTPVTLALAETMGGRTVSTLQFAREALEAYDARPATVVAARR